MKRRTVFEADHSKINCGVKQILSFGDMCGIELHFKLADRMEERGLTVRQLAEISGLRLATISDIMNGNRSSINYQHIIVLMMSLRITKLSDLIEIHFPDVLADYYNKQSFEWIKLGEPPLEVTQYKQFHTLTEKQLKESEADLPKFLKDALDRIEQLKKINK